MDWYLSKLVFQIVCGNGDHTAQFDEQLRLISANSKEEAFYKAKKIGSGEEDVFYNHKQQLVKWQFVNVSQVELLQTLEDGIELCSRIEEIDDAENYIAMIDHKAENILKPPVHQLISA